MGKRKQKRGSKEGRCGRRRVREWREWAQSQGVLVASRSLKDKEADSPSCLQKANQPSQHLAFSPVRPVLDPEPTELCEQRVRDKGPRCLSPPQERCGAPVSTLATEGGQKHKPQDKGFQLDFLDIS